MKTCKVDGCKRTKIKGNGMCELHYRRWKHHGTLEPLQRMDGYRLQHPELYKVWARMRERCSSNDPKVKPHYKDRNITVCKHWSGLYGFQHFVEDMGDKPSYERTPKGMPIYTLDRIDSNRGYCPENCRWADWRTQAGNRRNNNLIPGISWDKPHSCWAISLTLNGITYKKYRASYEEAIKVRKALEQKYPQVGGGT